MHDIMLLAIQQLEEKLAEICKQRTHADLRLEAIISVRKTLQSHVNELSEEYRKLELANKRYMQEAMQISSYGSRAVELSRKPKPLSIMDVLPAINEKLLTGKEEIYKTIISTAVNPGNLEGRMCGVYFLLEDNEIVYIGQSVDCMARVSGHARDITMPFNRACYVPIGKDELDIIEQTLILIFKPKLNRRFLSVGVDERKFNLTPKPPREN